MTYIEILILITEAHGDDFTSMFPTPGIDMGILQQVVAHLTFIAGKYHIELFVISKYFLRTRREMSFSR